MLTSMIANLRSISSLVLSVAQQTGPVVLQIDVVEMAAHASPIPARIMTEEIN
jgi:hypothetical protein